MSLKKILEDYIVARENHKKAAHELAEAETRLEMECRRMGNTPDNIIDGNIKMISTILLGKLQ